MVFSNTFIVMCDFYAQFVYLFPHFSFFMIRLISHEFFHLTQIFLHVWHSALPFCLYVIFTCDLFIVMCFSTWFFYLHMLSFHMMDLFLVDFNTKDKFEHVVEYFTLDDLAQLVSVLFTCSSWFISFPHPLP